MTRSNRRWAAVAAVERNAHELRERVLKYIMVRRTRREMEEFYGDDLKKQKIWFPKVSDPVPLKSSSPRICLERGECDGMPDGMATMTHRTTFALDETTAHRLKRLAARWQVSQAEGVRRSLEKAEEQAEMEKPNPVEMLRDLFAAGKGLDPATADSYIAEVYEDRKHWRGEG